MLQHFFQLPVLLAYALTIGLHAARITSTVWYFFLAQGAVLALVDYLVHSKNHEGKRLVLPLPTVCWISASTMAAGAGWLSEHWQAASVFFLQAWWDNS